MKKVVLIFGVIMITLLFCECASTGFLMGKPEVSMFGRNYPPKNEKAIIDVYITNMPTDEYVEFAQIKVNDTSDKWCLEQIQKKAREIGADAVIIIGKAGSYGFGVPIGGLVYGASEQYGMTAIAIRYK